jgi:probable rRNA maturation factor
MRLKADPGFSVLNRQRAHRIDRGSVLAFLTDLENALGRPRSEAAIVFVTDRAMREYNRRYRHMDKPTDVLSFEGGAGYLGDIVISTETAWRQAARSPTLTFENNIRRLVLHGMLHLHGYDHETDNGEMRAIERRLRAKFGC